MKTVSSVAFAAFIFVAGGCESTKPPVPPSPAELAGAATFHELYPALMPDVPQVQSSGGPVMDSPQVVAITFPGDAMVDDIEAFAATIGTSAYWGTATSEYGVGAITGLPPIRLTETAPATLTDGDIHAWLQAKVADPVSGFPAPSVNTLYTLYYPSTTSIDDGSGQLSCQAYFGYHNSTVAADGMPIVYAVLPRCSEPGLTDLQALTSTSSHELSEAVTDPQPLVDPAYLMIDDKHAIWSRLVGGGEVADMCAQNSNANYKPDGFPYFVQRIWSNASAASGNDPCVPAPTDAPYFNASPVSPSPDQVTYTQFGFPTQTEGYIIPVGTSKTINLGLYSSGATSGPWQLSGTDLSAKFRGTAPTLDFTFSHAQGKNADHVTVTIKALAASSSRSRVTSFVITSTLGELSHVWISLVQATANAQ